MEADGGGYVFIWSSDLVLRRVPRFLCWIEAEEIGTDTKSYSPGKSLVDPNWPPSHSLLQSKSKFCANSWLMLNDTGWKLAWKILVPTVNPGQ